MVSCNLKEHADSCIGVFDSGVGGLSVVRALLARLPHESLLYVGDDAHCPYGTRPPEEIIRFSREITRYLIAQSAKMIIVACNTVSVHALSTLRAAFPDIPIVGMMPAVASAVRTTRSGVVGVLATPATIAGRAYQEVVRACANGTRVISQPCPGLVERVELGDLDGPETMALLSRFVQPLLERGADTLVLGCSHYPFLSQAFRRLVGGNVRLVEAGGAIAREAAGTLADRGLLRTSAAPPERVFATSGDSETFLKALYQLLGYNGPVRQLCWREGSLREASLAQREAAC